MTDEYEVVVTSYIYDSFGNLIASSGATTNAYGFTGEQQFNEADNLVFLRARYYDPRIGRFISRDPFGEFDNLYKYASNNPVNYTDPSGLCIKLTNAVSIDCYPTEEHRGGTVICNGMEAVAKLNLPQSFDNCTSGPCISLIYQYTVTINIDLKYSYPDVWGTGIDCECTAKGKIITEVYSEKKKEGCECE
ncbi:MAG: RHS repeat-associated core domain-containing protein [Candidatus Ratteibacteria bacterium]|nr:RHS repeat-associated core domain-containing protein [Candidatus Ratteibacteria bacterium]